jgi:hypothetical protein
MGAITPFPSLYEEENLKCKAGVARLRPAGDLSRKSFRATKLSVLFTGLFIGAGAI